MIQSVQISNWRSHKNTYIEFTSGTNVLVGIMGAGKTSVLEALCYALYGNFPALQKKKVKLSQITSRFALSEPTEINVIFQKNDKKYSVKRTIENGKSNAELREEEKLLETKSEAVTSLIEKIIQVDYNTFVRAIYTEQNSLDSFLNLNPQERKRNVDELMGMDKFEIARGKSTKLINIINRNLSEKMREVDTLDKEKKNNEKRNTEEEISKNKGKVKENSDKIEEIKSEKEKKENKLNEEINKKKEYEKINEELVREKIFIEQNEKEIKNYTLEELNKKENRKNEIEKELQNIDKEIESKDKEIKIVLSEVGTLKNKKSIIEKSLIEKGKVESELKEIGNVQSYEELKEKSENLIEQIKKSEKEIWESENGLNNSKKEIENYNKSKKKLEEIDKEMVLLKGIIKREIEEKKSELENTIGWLATIKEIIKNNNESINVLNNESGARCPVCENELSQEKRELMIVSKKEIIKSSEMELEQAQKKIDTLKSEIKSGEEGLNKRESYQRERESLVEVVNNIKVTEEMISGIEKLIEERKGFYNNMKKEKEKISSEIDKAIKRKEFEVKLNELNLVVSEKESVESKEKEFQITREKNETFTKQIKEIKSKFEKEIYELKSEIEKIKRDLELQKQVNEKKNLKKELEEKILKLNYNEKEYEELNRGINEIKIKLSELETEKRMCESNLNTLEKNLELIKEDLSRIEKTEIEIKKLSDGLEQLKVYQNSLIETQINLRNGLITSINNVLEKVWKVLYPYGDYEKIKIEITDNDYVLSALQGSEWVHIEGSVSGGERASMVLALKVAFSVVLAPHLSMLILDEPTHNLDSNSVKSLCEILREKLPKIIKQVIVITHDEELKEGATYGKLYLFSRNKDEYEPTKIEVINLEV